MQHTLMHSTPMHPLHRSVLVMLSLCLPLVAPAAMAAAMAQEGGKPSNDEAVVGADIALFNGRDLAGWEWHGGGPETKVEDVWSVRDGILSCKGNPAGYIRTTADYTNFVLRLEWRFSKPGNSGVLLRVTGADKVWPRSIECQLQAGAAGDIWNIDQFPMEVAPERTNGRHTRSLHGNAEKPVGQWNRYEITLDREYLVMKVNGVLQNVATRCQVIPGKIGLQSEGAAIEFRNISLTPIN